MKTALMKVPKNSACRLSDDVWMISQAFMLDRKLATPREALEMIARTMADRVAEQDADFAKVWKKVRTEGVERGTDR